jgi:Protein of unknown function (DUF3515)
MPEAPVIEPVRRRAAVVATAVAIPVAVLLVLVFNRSAIRGGSNSPTASPTAAASHVALPPISVPPPPESAAAQRSCPGLIAALPVRLGDLLGRPVQSSSPSVLAWGEPPVVLRCGVPRPAAFVPGAPDVVVVNKVIWFAQPRGERTVWTVVDRSVYIEATVPSGYASAPIPPLSDAVTAALRPVPIRPGR